MAASRQHSQWRLFVLVVVVVMMVALLDGVESRAQNSYHDRGGRRGKNQTQRGRNSQSARNRKQRNDRPNIVLIMTDDQDVLLGSLKVMPKLQKHMTERGAFFSNMFVSTPMCCPSRSSFLTGMYVHNHNVYTNNDNCSSPQWIREHEPRTFATYLQNSGYRTGYFGKYLNKYNGTYAPVGWNKWIGLVRNSRFYNYTLSYGNTLVRHGDNYYHDYLTDRIANDSVTFLKHTKRHHPSKPFMMVLSVPAPHGPEDAAPQYQHMFVNNTDHRTPSWNMAPNRDKQWLLRQTQPLTPQYKIFTDLLQRRRLQTLQSVDDLVEKVHNELDLMGVLDNTFVIYTSDHGYHLGQFGLIKGKSMAYDFDTRVPLIISGPGVKPGSKVSNIAANVDLAPTLLDIGGVAAPSHMDGTSLLPLLKATSNPHGKDDKDFMKTVRPWRDSILLERGKVSKRLLKMRMEAEKSSMLQQNQKNLHHYLLPRQQKILRQCSKPKKDYQLPCKPGQKWYCQKDSKGRTRLHKCRHADRQRNYNANTVLLAKDEPQTCTCRDGRVGVRISQPEAPFVLTTRSEKQRHRRFLRQKAKKKARSKLIRQRRSVMRDSVQIGGNFGTQYAIGPSSGFELFTRRCRILMNQTVSCDQDIYRDYNQWEAHRERVDGMIKEYRKILEDLRDIREHLLKNRPPLYDDTVDYDSDEEQRLLGTKFDHNDGHDDCVCEINPNMNRHLDRRTERLLQRHLRKEQKQQRRAQRQEERVQRREDKRGKKKKNCNHNDMNCFSHDNDHWKTPPYWNLFKDEEGGEVARGCPSLRLHKRFNYPHCYRPGLECTLMDDCHWKTAPFWTHGPFCFCSNAKNNTYWCMRTVNATADFLYCEYITNFIAFYNMTSDPYQLSNVAKQLNYGILQQLHDELALLKICQGRDNCDLHNSRDSHILMSPDWNWYRHHLYEDSSGEVGKGLDSYYHSEDEDEYGDVFYDHGDLGFDDEDVVPEHDPDFF